MSSRQPLLALLAVLVAVLVWALSGAPSEAVLPELERIDGGATVARSGAPSGDLPGSPEPTRREVGSLEPDAAPLEDGDDELHEGVYSDGSILVEVQVLLPEGMPAQSPHPFAGSTVVTQSWLSEEESTESHEALIEPDGVARFRFDGWMHLDWFRADLPARFGLGPAFIEPHIEVEAGSHQRFAIRPSEGGSARGRVTTLDGSPLAGIEVCAWVDGDGEIEDRIGAWYPGHLTVVSGPAGWFEFESLPARPIFIAVRPDEWLQVRPDLNGSYDTKGFFELGPGELHDVGTLRLTPRTTLSIVVTDITGEPVRGAAVHLSPQTFRDPRLLHEELFDERLYPEDATEEGLSRARADAEFLGPWVFGDLEALTDDAGQVELAAVPGEWKLTILPRLCSRDIAVDRLVQLPLEELAIRLPFAVQNVRGQVVDAATQSGVARATVRVTAAHGSINARTDADGSFLAEDLVLASEYTLHISHADYFPEEFHFAARELAPRVEACRSYGLSGKVIDHEGKPVRGGGIQLLSVELAPEVAGVAEAQEWVAQKKGALGGANLNRDGSFAFLHLWPGKYQVALNLPMATGEQGEWGEAIVEPGVWKRWTLSPARSFQRLEVDFSTYQPLTYVDYCTVIGTVLDAETNEPLVGVEVEVTRAGVARVFRTNDKGRYNFSIPTGMASKSLRQPGYRPLALDEQLFRRGGKRPSWQLTRE